jgi:hypothetical protein
LSKEGIELTTGGVVRDWDHEGERIPLDQSHIAWTFPLDHLCSFRIAEKLRIGKENQPLTSSERIGDVTVEMVSDLRESN